MNSHCHADAAEQAAWFADDIAFKGEGVETLGMNTAQLIAFFMRRIGSHGSVAERARRLVDVPAHRPAARARLHDDARGARCAVRRADRSGPGGLRRGRAGVRAVGRQRRARPASGGADRAAGAPGAAGRAGRGVQPSPRAAGGGDDGSAALGHASSTRGWSRCSPTTPPRCSTDLDQSASWDAVLEVEPQPSSSGRRD